MAGTKVIRSGRVMDVIKIIRALKSSAIESEMSMRSDYMKGYSKGEANAYKAVIAMLMDVVEE